MPSEVETFLNEFYDTPLLKREVMVLRWFTKIRGEAIEGCAKLIDPLETRPCDCSSCHCANSGDAQGVAWWDASRHNADMIRGLLQTEDNSDG